MWRIAKNRGNPGGPRRGFAGRKPGPGRETGFAKPEGYGIAAHPHPPAREAVAWALLDDIPACAVTHNREGDPDVDHR